MKTDTIVLTAVITLFIIPMTAGVVGGPEPGEGEMAITSSSSSSASAGTSVGPNGTEWSSEVSMVNRSANISEDRLENINYSEEDYKVSFDGFITSPTPCHVISHEIEDTEDGYLMNITAELDRPDEETNQTQQLCNQQLTMIEYEAEFSTNEEFTLEVVHNNETVETLEHPGIEDGQQQEEEKQTGIVKKFSRWFSNLF